MVGSSVANEQVLGDDAGTAQAVEQGRFAGVGVAHQRDRRQAGLLAARTVDRAVRRTPSRSRLIWHDALADQPAVDLDLAFAGPPRKPKPPRWRSKWVHDRTNRPRW
jgi:hypothetical protein